MNASRLGCLGRRRQRRQRAWVVLMALMTLAATGDAPRIQQFLVRDHYIPLGAKGFQQAAEYRLKHYTEIRTTTFFGRAVRLHHKVHEPLRCVERRIKQACRDAYRPKTLSGWRPHNSYKLAKAEAFQEYSNHIFGIALDIDPDLNPCCGCLGDWAKVERCRVPAKPDETPLGRHEIPACWISAFEQHGFYWLGRDPQLRDTMHFEFLAQPGSVTCTE